MALAHWLLDGGFACFERRQALALRTSFILVHSTMKLLLRRYRKYRTPQVLSSALEYRCLCIELWREHDNLSSY